jgi:hypothetical protein
VRATRAYIASLGTTGVLVASSALLLVVVSGLVAFNAWPGGDPIGGIKGLVVDNHEPSVQLTGPARVAADAAPAAAAVRAGPAPGAATPARAGTGVATPIPPGGAGGGGERFSPPRSTTKAPAVRAPSGPPAAPPSAVPAPDVEGVSRGLGGTVEQVTGDTGKVVGQVNPDLGQGVSDTGKALSQIVQGVGGTVQHQLSPPKLP